MTERYITLFKSDKVLYTEHSPVVIEAQALLKDSTNNNVLVQLKFKNITQKVISALEVRIKAFDVMGTQLEGVEKYQYLDFYAHYGDNFGQKQAILMPDARTRSFVVECTAIVFEKDNIEKLDLVKWEKIHEQETLQSVLGTEMAEQYKDDLGSTKTYIVEDYKDLWLCACGAINKKEEERCGACNANKKVLKEMLDGKKLQEHFDQKQKEIAIREKRQLNQKRKHAKIFLMMVIAIAILSGIAIGIKEITSFIQYKQAIEFYETKQYEKATEIFETLGEYKDSLTVAEKCKKEPKYEKAVQYYKNEEYHKAYKIFKEIAPYKDSDSYLNEVNNRVPFYIRKFW